jgi:hypothetical protein
VTLGPASVVPCVVYAEGALSPDRDRDGGLTRPGAFGHGRRLLRLVPIEDALGAVELAGHVIGVVVDLPRRAPQRVVRDVRSKHAPLDAGGLDDVPDRLIVPVEVVREPDEIEAGIAGARALPVDDPGEGAVVAGEDVVGVQVQVRRGSRHRGPFAAEGSIGQSRC